MGQIEGAETHDHGAASTTGQANTGATHCGSEDKDGVEAAQVVDGGPQGHVGSGQGTMG